MATTTKPTTISGLYDSLKSEIGGYFKTISDSMGNALTGVTQQIASNQVATNETAAAVAEQKQSSNTMIYIVGGVALLLVFGKKLFR
jgi:uncharacterized RmlC-like cupin family protein